MSNKVIGTLREKRGDDHYRVVTSHDGEVVGIEQYDSIGHRWVFLNLFAESAPELVALIQKAAGISVAAPEYEYAIQTKGFNQLVLVDDDFPFGVKTTSQLIYWQDKATIESRLDWIRGEFSHKEYWMVKRAKAGKIEVEK